MQRHSNVVHNKDRNVLQTNEIKIPLKNLWFEERSLTIYMPNQKKDQIVPKQIIFVSEKNCIAAIFLDIRYN